MAGHRNGRVAAALAGAYAALVLLLGAVSAITLLTVQDPILLSGVALMVVTFPLGTLIWWGWDVVPPPLDDPVLLVGLLTGAGLLQSYVLWRVLRGPR
ncbi:hypothetical protein FXF51_05595 [Nonomuraea sp. PA05]|uniref:SCO4225 family membrane protein n=1 Tax=Nonomuraea sp. PA05 TaxID=2604466 RepID=UPI0011D5C473|nr:hypothetical protein [Nonomuraea sp. PA05]TYB69636.1 hypothetical protein FXF51_05595 [Nonomuraea sp. PA05]